MITVHLRACSVSDSPICPEQRQRLLCGTGNLVLAWTDVGQLVIAVGIPVGLVPPAQIRTGARWRIRFLSRMSSGKASIGETMEHSRWGKPALRQGEHPRPVDSVFLASAANTVPPADQHPMPEQG